GCSGTRVLPGLTRVHTSTTAPQEHEGGTALRMMPVETMPQGLALVDAPDLDSVVEANRAMSAQLLAAADLWVFVTTAHRYADAVPWVLLREAAERDVVVAGGLDRV